MRRETTVEERAMTTAALTEKLSSLDDVAALSIAAGVLIDTSKRLGFDQERLLMCIKMCWAVNA